MIAQIQNHKNLKFFFNSKDLDDFFKTEKDHQPQESFVYFARYGKSFDGHKFALQIIRSENFCVGEKNKILNLFSHTEDQNEILNSKYFICVDDVHKALNEHMKEIEVSQNLNFRSIGVTGTSGKTSVVQLTGQILEKWCPLLKIGSLGVEVGHTTLENSHQTTPDYPAFVQALQLAKENHIHTLIMEVSSHGLEENRLNDFKFDVAVFTNFSQDHLDFHKTMEHYLQAKTLLFTRHLKDKSACIISTQSPEWEQMVEHASGSERTLYLLLTHNTLIDVQNILPKFKNVYCLQIENKQADFHGLSGEFVLKLPSRFVDAHDSLGSTPESTKYTFHTPLIGDVNFENIMVAFCICHAFQYPISEFISSLAHLKSVPGRMQKVTPDAHNETKPNVVVDYSHKPGALEGVLKTLRTLLHKSNQLITVFGCGGDRDQSKRPLMGKIAADLSDVVIVTSDNPRTEDPHKIIHDILAGIPNTSHTIIEPDRRLAIERAFEIAKKSDIILIAGKGHETYQIIGNQKYEFSDSEVARFFLNS